MKVFLLTFCYSFSVSAFPYKCSAVFEKQQKRVEFRLNHDSDSDILTREGDLFVQIEQGD